MIEGKFIMEIAQECQGGARINYIFHEIYTTVIKDIDPLEYLTDGDIQCAIKNSSALGPSLFIPEGAFDVLLKSQVVRLLQPSLDCAEQVYQELRKVILNIQIPELTKYYRLQSKIYDVMEEVLDQCLQPTLDMIVSLIEIQNAHININHPDFIGGSESIMNLFQIDDNSDGNTLLTKTDKASIYEKVDNSDT